MHRTGSIGPVLRGIDVRKGLLSEQLCVGYTQPYTASFVIYAGDSFLTQSQFTDPLCPRLIHVDYRLLRRLMNHYHCYFKGGTGGAGGSGYGDGVGGAGGDGTGPNLNWDIHGDVINHHGESGIHILHRSVALEAIHDSAESFPQPRCHPDTRTQMLRCLQGWALNGIDPESDIDSESHVQSDSESDLMYLDSDVQSDSASDVMNSDSDVQSNSESGSETSIFAVDGPAHPKIKVLWLYGPAGAGKSAIMQTLATQLRNAGRLGGSFFFKCGHATRGNAKTLFATIAYQLALAVPWLRTSISQIVGNDPSVVVRSIAVQIKTLISDPCRSHEHENCDPVIILIDGLDECEGHEVQEEILHAIHHSSKHSIPLRFIVASRPEAHICEVFDSAVYAGSYCSFNVEQSFKDVRKYLCNEFSRIHREHRTMVKIPLPWPPRDVLEQLVEKSSGHFIHAATIIKFIDNKSHRPTERLAVIQDANNSGSDLAFDVLDQLYMAILSSAPRQSEFIPILCAIVHFEFRLAVSDIDKLFGLAEGETQLLLRGLHSVLDVPLSSLGSISSHHASFVDFLNNPDRSGNFCVSIFNNQISLARCLLQYYAGPFQHHRIVTLSNLIHFIVSLPSSNAVAELFPLIGSVNPHYIFDPEAPLHNGNCASLGSWFKNSPLAPANLIQLWEDYAFMSSIDNMRWSTERPSVKQDVPPSPELVRILISMMFLGWFLWKLPTELDLTWTDLRTTLCSLRPKLAGNEHILPVHQPHTSSWAARNLALQLIRKMVKNHVDTNGGVNPSASRDAEPLYTGGKIYTEAQSVSTIQKDNFVDCSNRLSLPCAELYHELWFIPPTQIWSSWPSGNTLIYHVSKWLESCPNSMMDLITFWQQAVPDHAHYRMSVNVGVEELFWRDRVEHYNDTIARLHLPDSLKIVL
ncbi:NACHT domain-containing protein [Mycena sanguinolenta]|uniref:NACHT domain-containing protein n=1 Tax=Mycena sanguinolenta TaxID=230812 RepID=A0A8H6WPX7_9AGAR|nr:NACHT domain-containing protein [Mycena sanguinolenta]